MLNIYFQFLQHGTFRIARASASRHGIVFSPHSNPTLLIQTTVCQCSHGVSPMLNRDAKIQPPSTRQTPKWRLVVSSGQKNEK